MGRYYLSSRTRNQEEREDAVRDTLCIDSGCIRSIEDKEERRRMQALSCR